MPAPAASPTDDSAWAELRANFHLPPGQIYLDGNSLGPLSRAAESAILRTVAEWATLGIGGWTDAGWIDLAERTAARLAPLIGAPPEAVALTGQTTVNLHQLLATVFDPTHPTRRVIVADALNFASDTHALASHLRRHGLNPDHHLRLVASRDGFTLTTADILAALTPDVQLLVLPSVLFVSGQRLDLREITTAARERGVLVGWDLAHGIGAMPHALVEDGADFAFWCTYKWLNGGPGAVGGLFLHPRHHHRPPGLAGWWGVRPDRRFHLQSPHEPAAGAARLQIGTPAVLSLAPLGGSLDLFDAAGGIAALRARSLALTAHLLALAESRLTALGFSIVTPRPDHQRGGHVALVHPAAGQICAALRLCGVVGDFRAPAVLRLAPSPFFTTFTDLDQAVDRIEDLVRRGVHLTMPAPASAQP